MIMLAKNSNGEKVIALNENYYQTLSGADGFICCEEYQNATYCFRSNIKQGCVFCEFDESEPCECAVCEK